MNVYRLIVMIMTFLLVSPLCVFADESPELPCFFYGSLTVTDADGTVTVPGPAGLAVSAKIAGSEVIEDTLYTTEDGKYGWLHVTDDKLMVGKKGDVTANAGVFFFVNGIKTIEEATFISGAVKELALTVKDETGPVIGNLSPAPETSTTNKKPVIGATLSDDLAGFDQAGVSMKVDGNTVTPEVTGGKVQYTPVSDLATGSHSVEIIARDMVGNETISTWNFNVISGGSSGGSSESKVPDTETPTEVAKDIDAASGGSCILETPMGVAEVKIPAGSLSVDATATIKVLPEEDVPPVPSGALYKLAGVIYEITIGEITSFNKPITITLPYDPALIDSNEVPSIQYYDEATGTWVDIGGTVSNGTISVSVSHLTIFAVFAKQITFTDLAGHWAEPEITGLVKRNVITGYPDRTFKPEQTITRAEFAVVLARALNLPAIENSALEFADAASIPDWAKERVAAAVEAGLIQGYPEPDGTYVFKPYNQINRAEIAVMVTRALKADGAGVALSFADAAAIPDWAAGGVAAAVAQGIVSGYSEDNTFRPQSLATRAEAAVMVWRMIQKI
jgi:hypothetical protein